MQVNPQQLLDDGFIILRQVVPPEQLDSLRASYETIVERQNRIWAGELDWDEPVAMDYKSKQPRIVLSAVVDAATADTVEFNLHAHTLGVSRQLMQAPEAALVGMFFMCNPATDHGPDPWHRDVVPDRLAPLRGLQQDMLANAPGYVQWNIPLYDDDVLWVVPGSHRRPNTAEEERLLTENARAPLPGGVQVRLKAGDGVVYSNLILHWPSDYSTKLRRTIHLGYRSFGGALYPYDTHFYWDLGFTKHLSPVRERSSSALPSSESRSVTVSRLCSAPCWPRTRPPSARRWRCCIPARWGGWWQWCSCRRRPLRSAPSNGRRSPACRAMTGP